MLIEGREFDATTGPPQSWNEAIFIYSAFRGLEIEGLGVGGALLYCELERVNWYWGFFNTALIAHTRFVDCVFYGCSFRSVDFIKCRFERCRFVKDNLGGACVFDDCRLVECVFENCEIAPETRKDREPVFTRSRFYGCARSGGRGFENIAIA